MMGRAILASAAISGLVLPISVDGRIATDGGWVRNFPFEHAYRNPDVAAIAAFSYVPSYPASDAAFLERTRERLERFRAVPRSRALLAEVRLAQERASRGEPAHYGELIVRLMRVAFARNAVVEDRLAGERETSVQELQLLREDVVATSLASAAPWRRRRLREDLEVALCRPRVSRSVTTGTCRRSSFAARRARRASTRHSEANPVARRAQASADRARLRPHGRSARAGSDAGSTRPTSTSVFGREADAFRDLRDRPSPLGDVDLRGERRSAGVRAGGRTPCRVKVSRPRQNRGRARG